MIAPLLQQERAAPSGRWCRRARGADVRRGGRAQRRRAAGRRGRGRAPEAPGAQRRAGRARVAARRLHAHRADATARARASLQGPLAARRRETGARTPEHIAGARQLRAARSLLVRAPGRRRPSSSSSSSSSSSPSSSSSSESRSSSPAWWVSWKRSTSSSRLCSSSGMSSAISTQSALSNSSVFEDLVVDLGRVVDDDHDLGLGVEVGARAERQLVELEAARVGHRAFIPNGAAARAHGSSSCERARDLGLHVERLEALAHAPFVAGERPAGAPPRRAPRRALAAPRAAGQQAGHLGVDVERRLAPAHQPFAARAQHLADLLLVLGVGRGGVGGRRERAAGVVAFAREPALADLVVHAVVAARDQEQHRHHQRERDRAEHDEGQPVLRDGRARRSTSRCARA